MGAMASQITSLTIVHLDVYSGAGQRKHQSSASLAFVGVIHRWPVNFSHKWPVTRIWWRHHVSRMQDLYHLSPWYGEINYHYLSQQQIHFKRDWFWSILLQKILIRIINVVSSDDYFWRNRDIHSIGIHDTDDFHVPYGRLGVRKFAIIIAVPGLWNSIPLNIQNFNFIDLFKMNIRF